MPRREWSQPFNEVREEILGALTRSETRSSDELVAITGLPFEDVISALRLLRKSGELEFEPVWAEEGLMSAARDIRLAGSSERGSDQLSRG